jgi:hypothetical protein
MSVIKPATLKALIESKEELDRSELKKDFLEFVAYLEKMAIIHDEHCHVVEHEKTGDSGINTTGKSNNAGSRSSGHNSRGSAYGGGSDKASDRERTNSGHERSSDSTGSGMQSARNPPPCLNTNKCAGEKHYLSKCPQTEKDEAIDLLPENKKKKDTGKKKAKFKILGNNGATADNRDGHTAYLTAQNLGVKVTVLADRLRLFRCTAPCCGGRKEAWLLSQGRGVAGAHHAEHGHQGRRRQADVQCNGDANVSGGDHHAVGASVHAWSATDHCRRRFGPSIDWKAGLERDRSRGESAPGICTGQIPPARLQSHWRGSIGDGQAAIERPIELLLKPWTFQSLSRTCRICYHWRKYKHEASGTDEAERT